MRLLMKHARANYGALQFHKIAGDGNCQFRALAHADPRYGEHTHGVLRRECIAFVKAHPAKFENVGLDDDDVAERQPDTMAKWAKKMAKEGTEYGDEFTLVAAAHILQRPIIIFDYHGDQPPRPVIPRPWPQATTVKPIFVRHQRKGTKMHYDLYKTDDPSVHDVEMPVLIDHYADAPQIDPVTISDDSEGGDAPRSGGRQARPRCIGGEFVGRHCARRSG